jgi:hypothetical protein
VDHLSSIIIGKEGQGQVRTALDSLVFKPSKEVEQFPFGNEMIPMLPITHEKAFVYLFGILTLFGVLFVSISCGVFQNSSDFQDDTFVFKYPAEWEVEHFEDFILIQPPNDDSVSISVDDPGLAGDNPEEIIQNFLSQTTYENQLREDPINSYAHDVYENAARKRILVGWAPSPSRSPQYEVNIIAIVHGERHAVIVLREDNPSEERSSWQDNHLDKQLESIVSSFRFY